MAGPLVGVRYRRLAAAVLEAIRECAVSRPHVEHCGVLLARPKSESVASFLAYPGPLRARDFTLPPEWLLRCCLEQRALGWEVAGFYHTHPPGESLEPSQADLDGHPYGSLVLLVGPDQWRAYRAEQPQWRPLELDPYP